MGGMMYYQYFRLKGPPFQAASPDSPVYFSPTHLEGLATLESGLSGDLTGLTMLTGEVGTGKTTLIYSLLQRDYKRVRIAHIDDPKLSFLEIMRIILNQLNLYSTGSTKLDYLEALDRFLKLRGKEERIAIVVDESQALSDDVLEELRLLSSHGQQADRGLQLILVGQPELADRLKRPQLRQLNQRISSRGVLKPLNYAQAANYVECRLIAQGSKCSAIFAPGALKRLLRRSDGIPRKINVLCHSAMLAAFYAGEKKVSAKTAKKVAAEYHDSVSIIDEGFRARLLRLVPPLVVGAGVAWLLLLGFGYPKIWSHWLNKGPAGGAIEQTARPGKPVAPAEPVAQAKPADQAEPVAQTGAPEQAKPVEQADFKGHSEPGAPGVKPKAAALVTHPAELRASLAPGAAAPALAKSEAAAQALAPETHAVAPASAEIAGSGGSSKQASTPRIARQRKKITVRYGDTLEEIAIRYLGSKSKINQLIDANPQLTNINQLSVGQIIYLPDGTATKSSNDRTATVRPVSNAESTVR